MKKLILSLASLAIFSACSTTKNTKVEYAKVDLAQYTPVKLTTDLSKLTPSERKMIPYLIEAANVMNDLFWYEGYGKKQALLEYLKGDARKYAIINYGPWDRLDNDLPFVKGVGLKPLGANFYPTNMTKEEFEKANLPEGKSLYTFVRRNMKGELYTIPYHQMFEKEVHYVAELLQKAASISEDKELKNYLLKRADAMLTDNYYESDLAWINMKNNTIDVIIGPIETYEDQLFGFKAAHEAYVLIKDKEWSKKLDKYASYLPELQKGLPVPAEYKKETPGSDSDLGAYDVIYYAGNANAGSKTIAVNLPNDEKIQLEKGTRRLQLKNAMQAKFDKILIPIVNTLISPEQRKNVNFDAFFANTMFHEVAHGLGIKNTINGRGTVRENLKEYASALEEGKADILGLYMVSELLNKGVLDGNEKDFMVTFMAGIFRSVRFGASSAHGIANTIRFNYFKEQGAFSKNSDGTYVVNFDKFKDAVESLSRLILTLQGDGDYEGVKRLVEKYGKISPELQKDLDKLNHDNIPVDIDFIQGIKVLGYK
ncbi:dipeptidyl-peptidase 3 family protein [Ornithobacterium rhinotracheale]|uniref:dipeptidyl-peptidase 3 family protein n=1 Tax=Ornithobacterium rhinotracheale TaxID=28251 RepID=UPI0040358B24